MAFNAVSLPTNVPLHKTVNIILKRVYQDRLIKINVKKRSLKKLLSDACTKLCLLLTTKFMNRKMMPVLADIILTKLGDRITKMFVDDGTIKFYGRYVDDTLLVSKFIFANKSTKEIHEKKTEVKNTIRF